MDYYSILGVSKTSTQDEIKRAYRKLAMKHHPDKGGHPAQFQKIQEAYDTLGDKQKRQQYDQPQPDFHFRSAGSQNPFEGTPFGDFFNQAHGRQHHRTFRNKDINVNVIIGLGEVITGKSELIRYNLANGNNEHVRVEIPPGARDGDTVKYNRLGDNAEPRLPRGDLYVKIRVRMPNNWDREGNNLVTKIRVNVFDMITGTSVNFNSLDGKTIRLTIPAGTVPGTVMNVRGYGIPDLRTSRRGSIYVQVDAEMPKNIDEETVLRIQELKQLIEEKKHG